MTLKTIDLAADVGEVLLTEEAIQSKIAELGAKISADYGDRRLTLVDDRFELAPLRCHGPLP